jgi:hypothetical protein
VPLSRRALFELLGLLACGEFVVTVRAAISLLVIAVFENSSSSLSLPSALSSRVRVAMGSGWRRRAWE